MSLALTEVVAAALEAAAWEMCASLIRTAYSPNVKERADCSTGLCDVTGRTLSLATYGPAHLGSMLRLVPAVLERFPLPTIRPGDVFFANDPYVVGVTHLNDCTLAAPVFVDGEIVAFAAAVAHHSDVGGRVPGSESGDCTSIYQEGIRVPPVRLFAEGVLRKDVLEMFLLNSRTPHFSEGDVYAQLAAASCGIQRLQELYRRHGAAAVGRSVSTMLDATEQRMRSAIRQRLRDGVYKAVDWLDEDGISVDPVRLAVTVTVAGDEITFDFSDCAPQLGSGKNIPYTHTMATVYYCLKAMSDPNLAVNAGMYRPIKVIAPEGSVVNPCPPAGVSSRNLTSMILADVMVDALGQAVPERAMAAGGPYQGIILAGPDRARNRFFVDYENFAGGQGARCDGDGMDVVHLHMSNTSNLPIEVMEVEFPIRVERYEIVPDSGGAGSYRGGCGVHRDLRILDEGTVLSVRSARQRFVAQGRDGGLAGSGGAYILNPGTGNEARLRSTFSERPLARGDVLRIVTPGGGGLGDPRARPPEAVLRDLREGKVTAAAARALYGVACDEAGARVDMAETGRLRQLSGDRSELQPRGSAQERAAGVAADLDTGSAAGVAPPPAWSSWFTTPLAGHAPDIAALIARQDAQNRATINLVASESYCPLSTLQAEASILVNKNASGYPPRVSFAGGEVIDAVEHLAIERAKRLFGAEHANVQSLSSTIANVAVLRAILKRGGRILAFDRAAGGHSSHGSPRHVSGQDYESASFGVDEATGLVDYGLARERALALRPQVIIAGSSAYPRQIDFGKLHEIATEVGAMLFADIAHVAGLVIAGLHPNPTPYCDVVTTSTHKTFCGPRTGGLILSKLRHAAAIDAALAPGLQAAPGAHIIAARAVLFDIVQRPAFRALMQAVVADAALLAEALAEGGLVLYAGGTSTHMVVVDLRRTHWKEAEVNAHLERHGIIANTTHLPRRAGDLSSLGLRLGSTPMTIRGLDRTGYRAAAGAVSALVHAAAREQPDVARQMLELARAHPIPE